MLHLVHYLRLQRTLLCYFLWPFGDSCEFSSFYFISVIEKDINPKGGVLYTAWLKIIRIWFSLKYAGHLNFTQGFTTKHTAGIIFSSLEFDSRSSGIPRISLKFISKISLSENRAGGSQ